MRNQKFFRVGEVSCNIATLINISLTADKRKTLQERKTTVALDALKTTL